MTFLSLFAGIGGFDLGLEASGFTCAGQIEIEPHCRRILERNWPETPRHDDVATFSALDFGPVDLVTFGSPCQDLSVAGQRKGLKATSLSSYMLDKALLAGLTVLLAQNPDPVLIRALLNQQAEFTRSGLFFEAARIIREMQEASNYEQPRFAVWENVPGAYSSNRGRDFATVLETLVGGSVSVPPGGWGNAGVAFGPLGQAAWRTLDSQHFGVPQRRRRIFLVADFRGERAGEVLFEFESLLGDSAAGGKNAQAPAPAREGAAIPDSAKGLGKRYWDGGDIADTLEASISAKQQTMPEKFRFNAILEPLPQLLEPTGFDPKSTDPVPSRVSPPIRARMNQGPSGPAVAFAGRTATPGIKELSYISFTPAQSGTLPSFEASPPILSSDGGGNQGAVAFEAGSDARPGSSFVVRRFTPRECERLQSFPDDFTRYDSNGLEIPDTHRYRMLGNAVTVRVVAYLAERLARVIRSMSVNV